MANKYHAIPTEYDGQRYDSRGEANYARHLDFLKAAGHILDWRRGSEWVLVDAPNKRDRVTLRVDFEVWLHQGGPVTFSWVPKPDGKKDEKVEVPSRKCDQARDFKGMVTREFKVKAKVWKAVHPGVPLMIVKADGVEVAA